MKIGIINSVQFNSNKQKPMTTLKQYNDWYRKQIPLLDESTLSNFLGKKHAYQHDKNRYRKISVDVPHNLTEEMRSEINKTENNFVEFKEYLDDYRTYIANKILRNSLEGFDAKFTNHRGIIISNKELKEEFEVAKTVENAFKIVVRDFEKNIKRIYFFFNGRFVDNYVPGKPILRPEQYTYALKENVEKFMPKLKEDLAWLKKAFRDAYKKAKAPATLKTISNIK